MKAGSFDEQATQHQIAWRRDNITGSEMGWHDGKQYEWILPRDRWEEGLWPSIRTGTSSALTSYLETNRVQKHRSSGNLKSSWMLRANFYFPFRDTERGRELLAGFLREKVHPDIASLESLELEYEAPGELAPQVLLGETGGRRGAGQTSPDVAFLMNDGEGLVLTECKFTEHSFYRCSARVRSDHRGRAGNPDPSRCLRPESVFENPLALCHQTVWKRRYWEHLFPVLQRESLDGLTCCPAVHAGYQLFRQQALAEGIAGTGKHRLVVSCLAVDDRNEELRACLRTTGIDDFRSWGSLFGGLARFAVFTHGDWVAWVRDNDSLGHWSSWLTWIERRYGYSR